MVDLDSGARHAIPYYRETQRRGGAQADYRGHGVTAGMVKGTIGGIKRRWVVGVDCMVWGRAAGGVHRRQVLGMTARGK